MKFAMIADTHTGVRNDSLIYTEYCIKFFEDIFFPYLEKNQIDTIVHLGDIFDRRKYINFNTLYMWKRRVFDEFERRNLKVHVILGNHDVYFKNSNKVNSVELLLNEYTCFEVYTEPQEVTFDNTNFLMLPWVNSENYDNSLQAISDTKSQILLGHLDIKGFQMHRGIVNKDHGFEISTFNKFDMVFSGHYHHKSDDGLIHYLGSPYEMNWNDYGDSRGFHTFETNTRELRFIENPNNIFEKVVYNDEEKTLEDILQTLLDVNGKYIKVIVEKKTNPAIFDLFIEKVYELGCLDLNVVDVNLTQELQQEVVDTTKDTLSILIDYVNDLDVQNYKEEIIEVLKDLYKDAFDMEF